MVKVTKETSGAILQFLKDMKQKQEEFNDTENIVFPVISLYMAARKKIFFSSLLLHPLVLSDCPFYEQKYRIKKESELEQLLNDVIVFELTEGEERLSCSERDRVIQVHKALKSKREKNEKLTSV